MSDKVYFEKQRAIDEAKHTPFFDDRDAATVLELIRSIPPADVRPVVRGEWIERIDEYPDGNVATVDWYCSACGDYGSDDYNFCPNCGAEMNEEAVKMLKERSNKDGMV